MTVGEFCELYIESTDSVAIYDCTTEQNVFEGTYREASYSEYEGETICSFGIENGIICINIEA